MNIAYPLYFFLIPFIALVVLLYFFRKQYTSVRNPSNLLWQQVMNEWNASPWLDKLQHNLLFWLQIAALTLAMLALAGPVLMTDSLKGQQQIWIVDTSASMSVLKNNKPLLEFAREQMLEMTNRLNGQEVTILRAGTKPEIILNKESNTANIRQVLKNLTVTYDHENIEKAVQLAVSFAHNNRISIHVYSDFVKKEDLGGISTNQYIEVHNLPGTEGNVSLISFGVAKGEKGVTGLALIENQGDATKKVPFVVKNEDRVLFRKTVTVPQGKQIAFNIPNLPERRYYQASIKIADHYEADNEMTAIFTDLKPRVYAVGEINPFYIKGLGTLGIDVIQVDQKSFSKMKDGILLAEGIPINDLPGRPLIYVNRSEEKIDLTNPLKSIDSSLTSFVDFDKTYLKYGSKPLLGNWNTVAISGNHPIIQSGRRNGEPIVILNFALEDSDWPLHPGFPIFLYNSYQWLSKQSGFLGYFQPGQEKSLHLESKNDLLEIYSESGRNIGSFHLNEESFKAPQKPGIYQALSGEQVYYFSVFLDDREKKIDFFPSFSVNKGLVTGQEMVQKPNESLSFWLTLIVLVILFVEWEVYRRGTRA